MAIEKKSESTETSLVLDINNGDLAALRQIMVDWEFRDESSVLRYALAVMTKVASVKALFYVDEQGEKIGLYPSESVKKPVELSVDAASIQ